VIVRNPQGLHMRPATNLAQLASKYQSAIRVHKQDQAVNGKSPLELMVLGAEMGTELTIEATGPDAQQAVDAILALMASPSFNEETDTSEG
jgi:phosphocarrier protein HPr